MKIAYTIAPDQGGTDLLLCRLAEKLKSKGYKICGTVQINTECARGPCDMDVKVLPNGPTLRISQSLGQGSKGCRLDPSALETAVELVALRLESDVDLLIINKFGKHEADGRGFRTVIADAIALDIPVLVGTNALNLAAFQEFAGPDVTSLAPTDETILQWCREELLEVSQVA